MKMIKKSAEKLLMLATVLFLLVLSSCGTMGYSVLLWNMPAYNMGDGTIVPVYIKSNIFHEYVMGIPGTKEKIEVPLWQLSEPVSKGKAKKLAAKYSDYQNTYARCVLDGLPIRAEKINTSKQIYRLRLGEIIRVLYADQNEASLTGSSSITGKWLKVLTQDGSEGWCFSYNLRLFKMFADGTTSVTADERDVVTKDNSEWTKVEELKWYPESYTSMIQAKEIDIAEVNKKAIFEIDKENKKITFTTPTGSKNTFEYKGAEKNSRGEWKVTDTPISVTIRRDNFIVISFTDQSGKPKSYNYVTISENLDNLVEEETTRRSNAYSSLRAFGPSFNSSNYGTISFNEGRNYTWTRDNLSGKVNMGYFIAQELKVDWDGALGLSDNGGEKIYLYKKEANGLRLKDATNSQRNGSTIVNVPVDSQVMFFAK